MASGLAGRVRPRPPLVRLAVALAALAGGCTGPPAAPAGPNAGARAIAARHSLATARYQRSQGDLAAAEQALIYGLAAAPDDAALHRALAGVLIELGRSAEAEPHQRRADALDPPPPPPPAAPLAHSSKGVLVVLVPPVAGDRVPRIWPDDVVAATLERRLALRLPDAKIVHADPESVAAARSWLAGFRPRAVLSLRVERAYCGESQKDGRFGMAWLRVAAEIPADASAGATLVRALVLEPRLKGGCLAEGVARALEQALALPLVESALARSEAAGAARQPWTTAAVRTLFPGLGQRIDVQVLAGRSSLANGQLGPAAAAFERAARIDPEDPDVRAYLEETRSTLALSKQIKGGSREPALDPRWSPNERAAADAQLSDERRRRDELLALLAVLDEDLKAPSAEVLSTLPSVAVPAGAGFGPKLARERAGSEIEARGVYVPDGSILSRYYFARGTALPVLREEDTSQTAGPIVGSATRTESAARSGRTGAASADPTCTSSSRPRASRSSASSWTTMAMADPSAPSPTRAASSAARAATRITTASSIASITWTKKARSCCARRMSTPTGRSMCAASTAPAAWFAAS